MTQNIDEKTKEFIRGKKWKVLDRPSQSQDLKPMEHAFYLLKKRPKGIIPRNKQEAAVKAWKSITKENAKVW